MTKETSDPRADQPKVSEKPLYCSFCGKSQFEVRKLIAGPSVFICDECVELCNDIIAEEGVDERPNSAPDLMTAEQIYRSAAASLPAHHQEKTFRGVSYVLGQHIQRLANPSLAVGNLLLLGPAGSGKSELVKCMAEMLELPFAQVSAARLSGPGYFENESVLLSLLKAVNYNIERAAAGVVFIEQLESLAVRFSADVIRRDAQEVLMSIVEGAKVTVESGGEKRGSIEIDTSRILFVAAGDFGTTTGTAGKIREALRSEGILPGFVDRFESIVQFESLDYDSMRELLTSSGLLKEYQKLFSINGASIRFSDSSLITIARKATQRGGGIRSLRALMQEISLEASFSLRHTEDNVVQVTEEFVQQVTGEE